MASKFILLLLIIDVYHAQSVIESATLQVSQTSNNYAQIISRNIDSVDYTNGWTVNVDSHQVGYHWWIHFTNEIWKFKKDVPSVLTLKIYSYSQFGGADRDVIVSFSQNDSKYISNFIQLDGIQPNRIHPSCDKQLIPTESFATGNIPKLLDVDDGTERWWRISGWNYTNALPENNRSICCSNQSPMIFKIENNPILGYSKYIYTNAINSGWQQQCGFSEVWSSNDYIEIFVFADDPGETLNIYRFGLSIEYNQTLQPTTDDPTKLPTNNPSSTTELPSSLPTYAPLSKHPSGMHCYLILDHIHVVCLFCANNIFKCTFLVLSNFT